MHKNLYFELFDLIKQKPIILVVIILIILIIVILVTLNSKQRNLEGVKNKRVGNNQMGSARFMNEKDKLKYFKKIEYNPKQWRDNPNTRPKEQGMIWGLTGYKSKNGKRYTLLDASDSNTLLIGPPGIGKTSFFLMPQIEYAAASGQRLLITDTKGDIYRNLGNVMKEKYGYNIILIDFRNPTRGDSFNFVELVNKYNDLAQVEENPFKKVKYQSLAEKNAKIVAETIINSSGGASGNNAYFYDTAKGILTSTILLISKYGDKKVLDDDGKIIEHDTRHIVSVFKLIQEMSEFESSDDDTRSESKFTKLINRLDENDKTKWFAGASTKVDIKTASSCFSTALTILTKFIDTEIEQILCFDSKFTMEDFVKNKSAIFVTLPEEDTTKYFLFSLLLNQVYGQLLHIADEQYGGKFENTVRLFLDEFGTLPKIEGVEVMFTASRSRNILSVPIIQMLSQLKKYKEGENMIKDSCKNILFSNFSAISEDAQKLSKAMGKYTTQTGSLSRSEKKNSISYNMSARELMTADEISRLEMGKFILMRSGTFPCKLDIPLFTYWGVTCGQEIETIKEIKKPRFINVFNLENNLSTYTAQIVRENEEELVNNCNLTEEEKFNTYDEIKLEDLNERNEDEKMNENDIIKDIEEEMIEYDEMIIEEANKYREMGLSDEDIKNKIEENINIELDEDIKFTNFKMDI
ncbi:MAG: type IV secretory system conjugative DNA transfer family protein [Sarcina sp.]